MEGTRLPRRLKRQTTFEEEEEDMEEVEEEVKEVNKILVGY